MKTTVLFRMIVLVAMVFAGISNATVKAQNNNFITNEETVGDLVVSKVIYRLDGSLYRHMKYDFTYDDQKRMATKEAFKWDASTDKWLPYFKIDYTYSSNEITLVYARWNDSHRAYDASVEKSVYELNDANMPVAYMNYKWNDKWIEESSVNWRRVQQPVHRAAEDCRGQRRRRRAGRHARRLPRAGEAHITRDDAAGVQLCRHKHGARRLSVSGGRRRAV